MRRRLTLISAGLCLSLLAAAAPVLADAGLEPTAASEPGIASVDGRSAGSRAWVDADTPDPVTETGLGGYRTTLPDDIVFPDKGTGDGGAPADLSRTPKCPTPCFDTTFDGLLNDRRLSPGDPTGAGGDTHVVTAINVSMGVFDKSGAVEVAQRQLASLIDDHLASLFDPKIIYDQYTDTYVLVYLGYQGGKKPEASAIYVVSIPDATATDPGTWCGTKVKGDQGGQGKQWADYPMLGDDEDHVYISTNQFNFANDAFRGGQIVIFDKANLYDCNQTLHLSAFTFDQTRFANGHKGASLQPAQSEGTATDEILISPDVKCPKGRCAASQMGLFRIVDTGPSYALTKAMLAIPKARPVIGGQAGAPANSRDSLWDVGDLRLTNAFFDGANATVYGAHAIAKDLGSPSYVEAVSRGYEIAIEPTLSDSTLERTMDVGDPDVDTGWPAVATDSLGNVHFNVSRASSATGAKEFIGAWAAIVHPAETSTEEMIQFGFGETVYDFLDGVERWGDFNAVNRDPVDGTRVWYVNAYVKSPTKFRQVVAEFFDL